MSKDKIIDLEISTDGTYYTQKSIKPHKSPKPPKIVHNKQEIKQVNSQADEFLGGLDVGLDFVESIGIRVNRILNLRDQ